MPCCPPPTGLARYAEHPTVVVLAYLAAFTPWGVLYAFDFISSNWRSIQSTRRAGYFHLFASVVPLAYVCFYTHIQRLAKDYKEMSASIAAAVLCVIHIGRTLWGLTQLRVFASWTVRTLKCIGNMRYNVKPPKDLGWRAVSLFYGSTPLSERVDKGMLVNNSLIDNEFSGAELPVRLFISFTRPYRLRIAMRCTRPAECTVRWLTAFLCRFGAEFLKGTKTIGLLHRNNFPERCGDVAIQAFLQVTVSTSSMPNGERELYTLVSPSSALSAVILSPPLQDSNLSYWLGNSMEPRIFPYGHHRDLSVSSSDFRRFQYTLDQAKDSWSTAAWNLMAKDDREAVQSISVLHLQYFLSLMNEQGKDWNSYREVMEHSSIFLKPENHNDAVATKVLLSQLGYSRNNSLEDVMDRMPIKKDFFLSLLWEKQTNKCLLQTSVHIDNYAALIAGFCGHEKGINDRDPSGSYNYGYPHRWVSAGIPATISEQQQKIEVYLLENTRSTLEPYRQYVSFVKVPRKIGCVMDSVRSFLAAWLVSSRTSAAAVNWNPTIEAVKVEFTISRQLFDDMRWTSVVLQGSESFPDALRLVWECQYNVQEALAAIRVPQNLQRSPLLMMLCVLGFPALEVSAPEHTAYHFAIHPQNAPQDIHLQVSLVDKEARRFSIEIMKPAHIDTFRWQDWKDATMGRLSGQSRWMQDNEGTIDDSLNLDYRPTKLSDPVIEVDRQDTGLSQNLKYWTGWPPFHPRFGGFEIGQLNLREDEFVVSQDEDEGVTFVDVSSPNNAENAIFRKIESVLVLIADAFKYHSYSST